MSNLENKRNRIHAYPEKLYADVFQGESFAIPEDFEEAVQYCFSVFDSQTSKVLTLYYRNSLTMAIIAKLFEIPYSKAIYIKKCAIKQIRESECYDILKYGKRKYKKKVEEEKKKLLYISTPFDISTIMLEDLNLSTRTDNAIKHLGVETVLDLVKKTPEEIMNVRNMGEKSSREIVEKLKILGIDYVSYHLDEFDNRSAKIFGVLQEK